MTEGAFRSLSWESVDPLVAGPWQRAVGAGSRPFAVPTAPPGEFQIGRLRGAENGPEALPALDRLAAVPLPRSEDVARTAALREVIGFEAPGERPVPLCAISESGDVHWSVDPVAWIQGLLGESYVARWTRPLPSRVPFFNYARMPHAVKGVLERLQSPLAGYASKPCASCSICRRT